MHVMVEAEHQADINGSMQVRKIRVIGVDYEVSRVNRNM